MILCEAIIYIKESLEESLSKKSNRKLRKEVKSLVENLNELGNRVEKLCNEQHESELKLSENHYFS